MDPIIRTEADDGGGGAPQIEKGDEPADRPERGAYQSGDRHRGDGRDRPRSHGFACGPPVRPRPQRGNHGEDRAPLGRAGSSGRILRIAPCCRFGDPLKGSAILAGEDAPLPAATHCASKEA